MTVTSPSVNESISSMGGYKAVGGLVVVTLVHTPTTRSLLQSAFPNTAQEQFSTPATGQAPGRGKSPYGY